MHYVLRVLCTYKYWGALNKSTFTQHYYQHLCIQKSHTHTLMHSVHAYIERERERERERESRTETKH